MCACVRVCLLQDVSLMASAVEAVFNDKIQSMPFEVGTGLVCVCVWWWVGGGGGSAPSP